MINHFFPNGAPADLKAYGLVMPQEVRDSLIERQGDAKHRVSPVALTDGRYALNADVLSELHEGGLFSAVTPLELDQIEVEDWADVVALLPKPEEEEL